MATVQLLPNFSSAISGPSYRRSGANGEWRGAAMARTPSVLCGVGRISKHYSFGVQRRGAGHILLCPCLRAKRKSGGGGGAGNQEEELDEDLRVGLNEISTEALKVMLAANDNMVAELREKVDHIGEWLAFEGHLDAARFMLVVKGMLDHELLPEKDGLKGAYKKAYDKIASVIEDSGWILKQEGADVGGVEMVDDELMPPVLNSQY